jgi:hypothetical protein
VKAGIDPAIICSLFTGGVMSETGYKFSSAQAGDHDELLELVQGQGTYTSDISMPGQLHACFVRSPW